MRFSLTESLADLQEPKPTNIGCHYLSDTRKFIVWIGDWFQGYKH